MHFIQYCFPRKINIKLNEFFIKCQGDELNLTALQPWHLYISELFFHHSELREGLVFIFLCMYDVTRFHLLFTQGPALNQEISYFSNLQTAQFLLKCLVDSKVIKKYG